MADDDHRVIAGKRPELLQVLDRPLLQRAQALSAGGGAGAATAIPTRPAGVFLELGEFQRRPVSAIDLVYGRYDLHRDAKMPAENRGGLLGAALRARLQRRGSVAYQLGATRHLPAAQLIEL